MDNLKAILTVSCVSLLLSACIPPGRDHRIGGAGGSANSPQIVPESDVILKTPSWSPAVVKRNSRNVAGGDYVVQPGDSLYRIVSKTGASLGDIAAANNLTSPYILKVGQRLTIPSGLYHNVGAGETGIAIARAYGVPWNEIVSLNALEAPFILNIGQRLRLPSLAGTSGPGGSQTPEQKAAAFSLNIDDIVTGGEPAIAQAGTAKSASLATSVPRPGAFSGSFRWPLDGRLISRFGSKGGGRKNDGINIAAANGSAVKSAADGVVVYSGNEIGVFGGLILVDHGGGWVTAYGHLGDLRVSRGDKVKSGQAIGGVGETGYVEQPQLHFEIRKDRKPIDPITKLTKA